MYMCIYIYIYMYTYCLFDVASVMYDIVVFIVLEG